MAELAIEAQGGVVFLATRLERSKSNAGPPGRGVVNSFSGGSRSRLLKKIARCRTDSKAIFITFTYPARYPAPHEAKQHLRNFFERMRRAYPEASAFWRLEFQKRGAPHFHLIVYKLKYLPFLKLRKIWSEIISDYVDDVQPFVRIEKVKSHRGVMAYASKYVAKSDPHARYMPSGEDLAVLLRCFFITASYLHAPHTRRYFFEAMSILLADLVYNASPGRFWGVHNADHLPLADLMHAVFQVEDLRCLYDCKKLMRRYYERMNKRRVQGGHVFTERSYQVMYGMFRLIEHAGGIWLDPAQEENVSS